LIDIRLDILLSSNNGFATGSMIVGFNTMKGIEVLCIIVMEARRREREND
jgi:hypothetical protein